MVTFVNNDKKKNVAESTIGTDASLADTNQVSKAQRRGAIHSGGHGNTSPDNPEKVGQVLLSGYQRTRKQK